MVSVDAMTDKPDSRRLSHSHLNEAQYRSLILRQTEPPNSSSLPILSPVGVSEQQQDSETNQSIVPSYNCANCSSPLFSVSSRFTSGSGWPSFSDAIPGAVTTKTDWRIKEDGHWVLGGKLGIKFRKEILCSKCGGHLGHVFKGEHWEGVHEEEEGKGVTRYCVNGCSLQTSSEQKDE